MLLLLRVSPFPVGAIPVSLCNYLARLYFISVSSEPPVTCDQHFLLPPLQLLSGYDQCFLL